MNKLGIILIVIVSVGLSGWVVSNAPKETSLDSKNNFGIEVEKLSTESSFSINGEPCTKEAVFAELAKIPDDAKKLRLTIIGEVEDRKKVLGELEIVGAVKDKVVIQAYPPDDELIKKLGFDVTGKPSVYLQRPDGTLLYSQFMWSGAKDLIDAINKADGSKPLPKPLPGPNPTPNPNPNPICPCPKPLPSPCRCQPSNPNPMPWWTLPLLPGVPKEMNNQMWTLIAVVLLILLLNKKEK